MKTTYLVPLVGLFLGTIFAFGFFADFILVALCSAAGLGVGPHLEGRVSVHSILGQRKK